MSALGKKRIYSGAVAKQKNGFLLKKTQDDTVGAGALDGPRGTIYYNAQIWANTSPYVHIRPKLFIIEVKLPGRRGRRPLRFEKRCMSDPTSTASQNTPLGRSNRIPRGGLVFGLASQLSVDPHPAVGEGPGAEHVRLVESADLVSGVPPRLRVLAGGGVEFALRHA